MIYKLFLCSPNISRGFIMLVNLKERCSIAELLIHCNSHKVLMLLSGRGGGGEWVGFTYFAGTATFATLQ